MAALAAQTKKQENTQPEMAPQIPSEPVQSYVPHEIPSSVPQEMAPSNLAQETTPICQEGTPVPPQPYVPPEQHSLPDIPPPPYA